jgi:hypothetical protein
VPLVIFRVEYEVSGKDGGADCDHDEDAVDEEHEAIDVVKFPGPE